MAIQNDNTLVTKGDLKELYTDKIAPYLGGGISYYHTDRTGEELKSACFGLSGVVNVSQGSYFPLVKISGNIEINASGCIKLEAGKRYQIIACFALNLINGENINQKGSVIIKNVTDNVSLNVGTINTDPAVSGGTTSTYMSRLANMNFQYTNNADHDIFIGFTPYLKDMQITGTTEENYYSYVSIYEIGRIVDPVKYVSNNSDLQETPVGNIISYMGNSVPKHYLACDGATYSIGTYPELEAFIIDEFGSINYFGGDGSSTWAVPDLRGEFLRGTGTNSHENQGSGANIGEHQDATEVGTNVYSASVLHCTIPANPGPVTLNADSLIQTNKYKTLNSDTSTWSSLSYGLSTVRPTNTAVQYCIKYESTFHAFFSNAAYKVKVKATISSNTNTYSYQVLDSSDVLGDMSLIDGNYFIASIDGWYSLSLQGSTAGLGTQNFGIEIDGDPNTGAWNSGIGCPSVIYLEKGQKVRMYSYGSATTHTCYLNFCLLTSNYNPTIVSADSVYSENEQMIGYWKNGKPLYQKTIVLTLPEITTDGTSVTETIPFSNSNINIVNPEIGWVESGYVIDQNTGNSIAPVNTAWGNSYTTAQYFVYAAFHMNLGGIMLQANRLNNSQCPVVLTVRYTKTTDTASTLQVENSLLLNRPDLWTAGTEYHFGGGLYGKRIISSTSQTIAADAQLDVPIATGVSQIINSGGSFKEPSQQYGVQVPSAYYDGGWSTGFWYNSYNSTQDLYYWFKNDSANGSRIITYDVWVLYKK